MGDEIAEIEEEFLRLSTKRMASPLQYPDVMYRLTKDYIKHKEKLKFYRESARKVIEARLQRETSLSESDINQSKEDITLDKEPQIVLDSLLDMTRKYKIITSEEIVDNIATITLAGTDTTATTLKILLLMLAIHQDVQERVHEEILQVCPGRDQLVSIENVRALPYVEMVCKETMRLYPIGPMLGRRSTHEVKLDG